MFWSGGKERTFDIKPTQCAVTICHISFHITNNYFQEVQHEAIRVGKYENMASMCFLFTDASSQRGLTQSLTLTVVKRV